MLILAEAYPDTPSRQKNMDYSLCNSLSYNAVDKYTEATLPETLVISDVACQFKIHFKTRVQTSAILTAILSDGLPEIIWAVGKFYLGAHKDSCYAAHSLNHVHGVGQVDGETMESLWSRLNAISNMARAMGHANRQETEDAAFGDSNWKHITSMSQ